MSALTVTRDEQQYTKTTTNKEGAKEMSKARAKQMSKKIEALDDCADMLSYVPEEIEGLAANLKDAALYVLSAYRAAPVDQRSAFDETLTTLGELADAIVCIEGSTDNLRRRIAECAANEKE